MEIALTAGLVSVVLGTASAAQNVGTIGALGVGGYVALAGLWAAPVSGTSMNPARSFGPALASGDWHAYWVYVAGRCSGLQSRLAVLGSSEARAAMRPRARPHRGASRSYYRHTAIRRLAESMAKGATAEPEPGRVPIKWAEEVAEHDYAAALAYLSLKLTEGAADKSVAHLRKAKLTTRRANDILRASGLDPAPLDDPGVVKDLVKVIEGKPLSPVLVVAGVDGTDIADGFHRVSLVYRIDPYGVVPLKLAEAGRPHKDS